MVRRMSPDYILEDFPERAQDFAEYLNGLSTRSEKEQIRDMDSFNFVIDKAFSRDPTLRNWVVQAGQDVRDQIFDTFLIQGTVQRNQQRRVKRFPTIMERREVQQELKETIRKQKVVMVKPERRFVKAFVRSRPIRAIQITVTVKGRTQQRFRDVATGRFASMKKN
jgi:hypothetical protein